MILTREQVEHIANLARLQLSDEEISRYQEQLSSILEYIERLQTLDTSEIPPTSSVLPSQCRLREDIPQPGLTTQALLKNAPQVEKDQFQIPPIFE